MSERAELTLQLPFETFTVRCTPALLHDAVARWSTLFRSTVPQTSAARTAIPIHLEHVDGQPPRMDLPNIYSRAYANEPDLLAAFESVLYNSVRRPPPGWAIGHAAVLARRGKAYLFCGDSGAGKSVLALDLAERGWTYLSDEFAPVGPDASVLPVPRPVTFVVDELPDDLRRRLLRGRVHWTSELVTADGLLQRSLHILPTTTPPPMTPFPLGGVFLLTKRAGRRPRLRRLTPPAVRAFLVALRATFEPEPLR